MKNPNILLISIDSLRPDHLSAYGYRRETSPHLDQLAEQGVIYQDAFAPANWTGAAVTSILTGLYPTCHGYTNRRYYLDEDVPSLAALLSEAGYETLCFSNNMYISPETGLAQGFKHFYYQGTRLRNNEGAAAVRPAAAKNRLKRAVPNRVKSHLKDLSDLFKPERALKRDDGAFRTERALFRVLERGGLPSPYFIYIHYQEPHSIYFPPLPFRRRFYPGSWFEQSRYLSMDHIGYYAGRLEFSDRDIERYSALYDGEIAYLDWRLGRLFQFLDRRGELDRTVIMVTADHGESLGENGHLWHAFCTYDPLIRVPLIVRHPDWFGTAQRSPRLVQTNDLVPTILEGIGVKWAYRGSRQGQSLLDGSERDAILAESYNPEKMIRRWLKRRNDLAIDDFAHFLRDLRAYRTRTEKFIWASDGRHEFYDLGQDPGESTNLGAPGSDPRAGRCEKALQSWIGTFDPHVADRSHSGFDKDTWEKMKALGYA